jgi:hypothetical protein
LRVSASPNRAFHNPYPRKLRSRPTRSLAPRERRRVTPGVLLSGGRRYGSKVAAIQKCENWVRVRADQRVPLSLLLRALYEPGQLQGNDKSPDKAGSGGWPSPVTISFHAMRANLLANATAASLGGLRFIRRMRILSSDAAIAKAVARMIIDTYFSPNFRGITAVDG